MSTHDESGERRKELSEEHAKWLKSLVLNGLAPIYIGDEVVVADSSAGAGRNYRQGETGIVLDIKCLSQIEFNPRYLVYTIKTEIEKFDTYYCTLHRLRQTKENQLLEAILEGRAPDIEKILFSLN